MIQEEIARLTGTLKFNVDARPLAAFEKKLAGVTQMLQQFGVAANKKFNIKVSLDSRTLRAQLEKATNTKITFKNFAVSEEALMVVSKKICERLDKTPIRLSNIKVDMADLIAQKRFMRTLLGQMQVKLPVTISMKEAEAQLRSWKKGTESKYKLKIDADISQARFIANVRKSLMAAKGKIGAMQIDLKDPKLKLAVDQNALRAQIRAAISQHEFTVRTRVSNSGGQHSTSQQSASLGHTRISGYLVTCKHTSGKSNASTLSMAELVATQDRASTCSTLLMVLSTISLARAASSLIRFLSSNLQENTSWQSAKNTLPSSVQTT